MVFFMISLVRYMKKILISIFLLAHFCSHSSEVETEQINNIEPWNFNLSFYVYMAKTRVTDGDIESVLDFDDAVSNMNFAFMGTFGFKKNQWNFVFDVLYFDETIDSPFNNPPYNKIRTDTRNTVLTSTFGYDFIKNNDYSLAPQLGVNMYRYDNKMDFLGDSKPYLLEADGTWFDPVIGLNGSAKIYKQCDFDFNVVYGLWDDGRIIQTFPRLIYHINNTWQIGLGYRQLRIRHIQDGDKYIFRQEGPVIGFSYNW